MPMPTVHHHLLLLLPSASSIRPPLPHPSTLLHPLWLLLFSICLQFVSGCSPPPGNPFANGHSQQSPHQQMPGLLASRHQPNRLFAEPTHHQQQGGASNGAADFGTPPPPSIDRASALSGPVHAPEELHCYDFDDKCRWRNMEGLLVDELDWYQGSGFLDENRLRLATGTHLAPEGFYGIAATDKVEFAGAKAILVSDVIECQNGPANIRFMYWTSPEVKITVCVKSVLRLFPYFDYCSKPIENGDPGPAFLTLPEINEPMQIFIQAHNFVFNSAALQGGFAIIDNLEYDGELCEKDGANGNGFGQFAKSAPPQSALRPGSQQQIPLHPTLSPATSGGTNSIAEQLLPRPYDGFRSLLEWMIYGGGGNGQRKLQEMLAQTNNNNGSSWQAATTITALQPHQFLETAPTAPPPPPPPEMSQNTPSPLAPSPTQLPDVAVPKEPLRSLRIVQRERGGDFEGGAGDNEEEAFENGQEQQMQRAIGGPRMPMEIQKSLLVNGQMPANLHHRRAQPHLELLARKNGGVFGGRRIEEKVEETEEEEPEGGDDDLARADEEGPVQVEREEWIG